MAFCNHGRSGPSPDESRKIISYSQRIVYARVELFELPEGLGLISQSPPLEAGLCAVLQIDTYHVYWLSIELERIDHLNRSSDDRTAKSKDSYKEFALGQA